MTPLETQTVQCSEEVVQLAKELLSIPSPSRQEEAVCCFVANRLEERFFIHRQHVGEGRFNIIATVGEPRIIFNIHLDTVPEMIPVRVDEGKLFGRGAVDAKGPLSSLIIAVEQAVDKGFTDFGLALDVGEEDDLVGVRALVDELPGYPLVVVCEPTHLKLRVAQKGLLELRVVAEGVPAHSSNPSLGVNAIDKLMGTLKTIESLDYPEHSLLGKTVVATTIISGGEAANVIPARAEATVCIRPATTDDLFPMIRDAVPEVSVEDLLNYPAYIFDDKALIDELFSVMEEAGLPRELFVGTGFTTMHFWSEKSPTIIIGPGDTSLAHGNDEFITVDELVSGVRLYEQLISKYATKH